MPRMQPLSGYGQLFSDAMNKPLFPGAPGYGGSITVGDMVRQRQGGPPPRARRPGTAVERYRGGVPAVRPGTAVERYRGGVPAVRGTAGGGAGSVRRRGGGGGPAGRTPRGPMGRRWWDPHTTKTTSHTTKTTDRSY